MLILKFLQTLIKALNSDGTPFQVGIGMALGLCLGLTPIMSLHNVVIFVIAMLTTVSFPGFMLGWFVAVPLGFALDPLFDRIGMALLTNDALTPSFTWIVNTPVAALSRLNNTIVLGGLVAWFVVFLPATFLFRYLVARYREHVFARLQKTKLFQAIKASKVYGVYETFRP